MGGNCVRGLWSWRDYVPGIGSRTASADADIEPPAANGARTEAEQLQVSSYSS